MEDSGKRRKSEPSSPFAFITYNGPREGIPTETKSLIRRHAMKEIGKSRRRPKSIKTVELDSSSLDSNNPANTTLQSVQPPSWWLGVRYLNIRPLDAFLRYPVEIDNTGRELISVVFSDGGGQRPLRDAWFTVGLQDEAAFLQVLANSALHLESVRSNGRRPGNSPAAMRFQAMALASLRKRLGTAEKSGFDGLIGAVSGMMVYSDLQGCPDSWIKHYTGLKNMIRIRGGISELEYNESLRITLSWVELRGIYMLDLPPYLPLPTQWLHYSVPPIPTQLVSRHVTLVTQIWDKELLPDVELAHVYGDLVIFSFQCLDSIDEHANPASKHSEFGAWTNPMIHRLLSWRPADSIRSRRATIHEAFRLGMLLYLEPVWRFFGVTPHTPDILVSKLKTTLEETTSDWGGLWMMKLWILYMGAFEARDAAEEDWYCYQIALVLRQKNIQSWSLVVEILERVLWISFVFKPRDSELETKVMGLLERQDW